MVRRAVRPDEIVSRLLKDFSRGLVCQEKRRKKETSPKTGDVSAPSSLASEDRDDVRWGRSLAGIDKHMVKDIK